MPTDDAPRRPRAIIFDLDGTLVDTVAARIQGWREVLAEYGIETDDARLGPMIGVDGRRLAREASEAAGVRLDDGTADAMDRAAGARFDEHNRDPKPLPGVRDALDRLDRDGVIWAIATSSRAEQVSQSVQALALPHPPRIVDGSRVTAAKPAPDLLLLAADELDVAPSDAWYVGDSTWDMRAARAAGMRAVGVLAGSAVDADALRASGASHVVKTLDELRVPD